MGGDDGDEEVDPTALEARVGLDDLRGRVVADGMVGVREHDVGGGDRGGDLIDATAGVDDAGDVEAAAGEETRQETLDLSLHFPLSFFLLKGNSNLIYFHRFLLPSFF